MIRGKFAILLLLLSSAAAKDLLRREDEIKKDEIKKDEHSETVSVVDSKKASEVEVDSKKARQTGGVTGNEFLELEAGMQRLSHQQEAGYYLTEEEPKMSAMQEASLLQRLNAGDRLHHEEKLGLRERSRLMLIKATNKIQSLLDSVYRTEMYDSHGFQEVRLSPDQILKDIELAQAQRAKDTIEYEKKRKADEAKRKAILAKGGPEADAIKKKEERLYQSRKHAYNGTRAVVSGFWARDRPNDERLDPGNMKIYKWKTYKMRYPNKHWFELDHMFKRLPMAPKKVYRVKDKKAHGSYASLLDDDMMLVDENKQELVYIRDINGYYHQGLISPSKEEIWRAAHLGEVEGLEAAKRGEVEAKKYGVFPNLTDALIDLAVSIHSPLGFVKRDAVHKLEGFREDNIAYLNLSYKKHGKGFISVRDADGDLTNFNADIARLTAESTKERIENLTGIPKGEQKLFIEGKEWKDGELLNEHVHGGGGAWIDMMQATEREIEMAAKKRRLDASLLSSGPGLPVKKAGDKTLKSSVVHVDRPTKKAADKKEKGKEDKRNGKDDKKKGKEVESIIGHYEGVSFKIEDPAAVAKWKDEHDPNKKKQDTTKSSAEGKAMTEKIKQSDQIVNLVSFNNQEKTAKKAVARITKEEEEEDEEYEDKSPMFNQRHAKEDSDRVQAKLEESARAEAKVSQAIEKQEAENSRIEKQQRFLKEKTVAAQRKAKAKAKAPAKEEPKVKHHRSDIRRTLYLKGKDGKWHVRKEKVFKGGRKMTKEEEEEWKQAESPDYGIPVGERVEEEDEDEDDKEEGQQQNGIQEIGGANSHGSHSSEETVRPVDDASLQQKQVRSSSKSTDKASTKKQKRDVATKRVNMMHRSSQTMKSKSERIQAAKK